LSVRDKRRESQRAGLDARQLAWEILREVEDGAYADARLGHRLTASLLETRDQALVTRLVYGTLAWQGYLDHIIAAFAHRPPSGLDAPVRTVLRLALFQVCRLTKIPTFAAVDTAVDLIKRYRGGGAAGLVNAVLRRAVVGWQDVPLPSRQTNPIGHLSVGLSHPRWLVERWAAAWGIDETEALLQANNEPAPTVLRANRRKVETAALLEKLSAAGIVAAQSQYSPTGVQVEHGGAPEQLPGYDDGSFSVQAEASQLVAYLVAPHPGQRLLDACAAPGGKTTHLAELMDDQGEIIALDAHAAGIERIRQAARRLSLRCIHGVAADATQWSDDGNGFDAVLVDAPCSGFGTLRQHPEIRWRRTAADVAALAQLQKRLLVRLAKFVRPGGALVYATCTLTAEENDEVIAAALHLLPQFHIVDPRPLLPPSLHPLIGADFMLRTFPHRHMLDGFFAVRLQRQKAHDIVAS
jgi:16S rRNA (cytosine967-C5)-methyltransferase